MKKAFEVHKSPPKHWVGDGFPVRSVFSYQQMGARISPFLLLDYAGPEAFPPAEHRKGVGEHPHRGFETVTIVYQGELEHRDSAGNHGSIGPGDVQWMTAASGVVHEEYHSEEFARRGGTLEMAQLWVNLPAQFKRSPPGYQSLRKEQIPEAALPGGGAVRVIAGEFQGVRGPARTFTPLNVWDVRLQAGRRAALSLPDGHAAALLVRRGEVILNGTASVKAMEWASFDLAGEGVSVEAREDASVLALSGEPIAEPIVGYGPFVMNTQEEIRQAIADFQSGRMERAAQPPAD